MGMLKNTPFKSGNNAHVHKAFGKKGESATTELDDDGAPSTDPSRTHIGIKNPFDFPTESGRNHGN